jgi:HEAT repeat protein
MAALVAHPDEAVPWLSARMGPPFDLKAVPGLIEDLESTDFATRQRAARQLEQIGQPARPFLERALANNPPAETRRRAGDLLDKLKDTAAAYELRKMRIIDVLEHINTAAARDLLQQIADGKYDPAYADEAKRALQRAAAKP